MGVVELDVEPIQRRLNERVEPFVEVVRNDEATEEVKSGMHDAAAQLIEVLHQAHARKLGAMGHRFSCLANCVCGVNHADSMPPRRCRWAASVRNPSSQAAG